MKKLYFSRYAAILLALCLMCSALLVAGFSASATEEKGSVTVQLNSDYEGLPLSMVEIGSYENGELKLDKAYVDLGIKKEDFEVNEVLVEKLDIIEKYLLENEIYGDIARVNVDGNAVFTDVVCQKVYVIYQPVGREQVVMSPIFVPMPVIEKDGTIKKNVVIEPKIPKNMDAENMGSIILNKTGAKNVKLEGAVFSFWKKIYYTDDTGITSDLETGTDEGGNFYWKRYKTDFTTDKNGQISVEAVPFGTYRFIEEKAPEGYKLDSTPHLMTVDEPATLKLENELIVPDAGTPCEITVINVLDDAYGEESKEPDASVEDVGFEDSAGGELSDKTPAPVGSTANLVSTEKPIIEITGDDIAKYIIIGSIVGVSLLLVIIMAVVGKKGKNKKDDDDK